MLHVHEKVSSLAENGCANRQNGDIYGFHGAPPEFPLLRNASQIREIAKEKYSTSTNACQLSDKGLIIEVPRTNVTYYP